MVTVEYCLKVAKALAREAGTAILEAFHDRSTLQVLEKREAHGLTSPVTTADFRANGIICNGLKKSFPDDAFLSEETCEGADAAWYDAENVWIIDPLDGTECFIQGGEDFGIHIGLTVRGIPTLGVNYYPVTDVIYWAVKGQGAWKQKGKEEKTRLLLQRSDGEVALVPLISKSDTVANEIFDKLSGSKATSVKYVGSAGLRLCAIAEGSYNIYLASAKRAGLWDFLSGEVILREAGGFISDWNGDPIDYRRKDGKLPKGVIACGSQEIYNSIAAQLKN